MLSFFKVIRRKLIRNKNFNKYMLYAVGEIILVVIGILIALQVNNWNINRVNSEIESQILVHLKSEYQENYEELLIRKGFRARILNSTNWLLDAKDNNQLLEKADSVDYHLANSL